RRGRGRVPRLAQAQLATQARDFAPAAEEGRKRGEQADDGPRDEEKQKEDHQRRAPGDVVSEKEEAQLGDGGVREREAERDEKKQQVEDPGYDAHREAPGAGTVRGISERTSSRHRPAREGPCRA